MSGSDYEKALKFFDENNYGKSAEVLDGEEDRKLKAELERLSELLGDYSENVGGKVGQVISNYKDRIQDDLAKKKSVS